MGVLDNYVQVTHWLTSGTLDWLKELKKNIEEDITVWGKGGEGRKTKIIKRHKYKRQHYYALFAVKPKGWVEIGEYQGYYAKQGRRLKKENK